MTATDGVIQIHNLSVVSSTDYIAKDLIEAQKIDHGNLGRHPPQINVDYSCCFMTENAVNFSIVFDYQIKIPREPKGFLKAICDGEASCSSKGF